MLAGDRAWEVLIPKSPQVPKAFPLIPGVHRIGIPSFPAAGNAFCQAAKLHMQLQSKHDSATSFVDAGNAYKKADPQGKAVEPSSGVWDCSQPNAQWWQSCIPAFPEGALG